jgi:hypothetical protein
VSQFERHEGEEIDDFVYVERIPIAMIPKVSVIISLFIYNLEQRKFYCLFGKKYR